MNPQNTLLWQTRAATDGDRPKEKTTLRFRHALRLRGHGALLGSNVYLTLYVLRCLASPSPTCRVTLHGAREPSKN